MDSRALDVYSGDGLCNRLLVLLSGHALAEASGRVFGMDWHLKDTCSCPFDQLFQGEWRVRPTHTFDAAQWRDLRFLPPAEFPDLLQSADPVLRVRHHLSLIQPQLYPRHIALQERVRELFQSLEPIPCIRAHVESFRAAHFRSPMIGVHLRRGDFDHSRPDVVNNLAGAFAAVDRYLDLAPGAGILLCTDDGAPTPYSRRPATYHRLREQFRARYGARVVSPVPRSLDRALPVSIQDAVADLWLLRQTHFLVGTAASTFSALAVFGRRVPATMTAGTSPAYLARRRRLKRTGIYSCLHALGRLEFGARTPHHDIVRIYKRRVYTLWRFLRLPHAGPQQPSGWE